MVGHLVGTWSYAGVLRKTAAVRVTWNSVTGIKVLLIPSTWWENRYRRKIAGRRRESVDYPTLTPEKL
jgi:hypothetical protein